MPSRKSMFFKPSYLALLTMLAACLTYIYWPKHSYGHDRQRFLTKIPFKMHGWMATEEIELTAGEKNALGAEDYLLRWYRRGSDDVLLYVAFFASKHGNITHNPEKCYPGSGFRITHRAILECPMKTGGTFPVIQVIPVRDEDKRIVLYWFQEGTQVMVDKWEHVIKVLTRSILYNRTESFMVRVSMRNTVDHEQDENVKILKEFADLARIEIFRSFNDHAQE